MSCDKEKAIYWLNLATTNTGRGEHYLALCNYKMAAQYFIELGEKEQLKQILKVCPDVKELINYEE